MTTYIIFHQYSPTIQCPDGIASAWTAQRKYPDAVLIPRNYDDTDPLPEFASGGKLVIVDFSFPAEQIEKWLKQGVEIQLIDHHESARDFLSKFLVGNLERVVTSDGLHIEFDMEESGATLAWKVLFPCDYMPTILQYVRDRDLGLLRLPESRIVHEALSSLCYFYRDRGNWLEDTFKVFDALSTLNREQLLSVLRPIGAPLYEEKQRVIKPLVERAQWKNVVISGQSYFVPVIWLNDDGNETKYIYEVSETLYTENEIPFVLCINNGGRKLSFRSSQVNGTRVKELAVALRTSGAATTAGGHPHAAGASLVNPVDFNLDTLVLG